MNISQPNNDEEAAYLGLAIVDELIDLLIARNILSETDADGLYQGAVRRLGQGSNFGSKRAANFLAAWIQSKGNV